jgi:hypothetical protein
VDGNKRERDREGATCYYTSCLHLHCNSAFFFSHGVLPHPVGMYLATMQTTSGAHAPHRTAHADKSCLDPSFTCRCTQDT